MTISELIIVMAISTTLWGISTIALIKPQQKANIDLAVNTLIADIKTQQTKAMSGEKLTSYGIHLESDRYILFEGDTYDPLDSNNYEVILDEQIDIDSLTLVNGNLIFSVGSGEADTTTGSDSLIVKDANNSNPINLSINNYGAISKN